jgi:hypothetical protein
MSLLRRPLLSNRPFLVLTSSDIKWRNSSSLPTSPLETEHRESHSLSSTLRRSVCQSHRIRQMMTRQATRTSTCSLPCLLLARPRAHPTQRRPFKLGREKSLRKSHMRSVTPLFKCMLNVERVIVVLFLCRRRGTCVLRWVRTNNLHREMCAPSDRGDPPPQVHFHMPYLSQRFLSQAQQQ